MAFNPDREIDIGSPYHDDSEQGLRPQPAEGSFDDIQSEEPHLDEPLPLEYSRETFAADLEKYKVKHHDDHLGKMNPADLNQADFDLWFTFRKLETHDPETTEDVMIRAINDYAKNTPDGNIAQEALKGYVKTQSFSIMLSSGMLREVK